MDIRKRIEESELRNLSKYAAKSCESKGREIYEEPDPIRTCYAIDSDRIIHSRPFRREKDKTQVFIIPTNDNCMNRLTHTLEVAKIAKAIACALNLNQTLAEAIALGHDTAHTPFGHAGERALNDLYIGGYIHSKEAYRRLNVLCGMNLSKEVINGIVNHSGLSNHPEAITLEGQIAPFADKIAYLTSDAENAIEMGIIKDIPERVKKNLGEKKGQIIDTLIGSIIETSMDQDHISMDPTIFEEMKFFKDFAYENIYFSKPLMAENDKAVHIINHLYEHYMANPQDMLKITDENDIARSVVDYVAGMTDHFALNEYEKYFSIRHQFLY